MPTLMNCTPHEIVVVHPSSASYDEKLRKHILVQPLQPEVELARILPSGTMLSVSFETKYEGDINGIPVITKKPVALPTLPDADYCIVSQLFAGAWRQAGKDMSKLLCVGDPVYETPNGKQPVGVLNLQVA